MKRRDMLKMFSLASFGTFLKVPPLQAGVSLGPDKTGQDNMAVKGKQKVQKEFTKELFVGLTAVKVVAVNPSRAELNTLVGREPSPDDTEITYLGTDNEGNDRVRLAFWLQDVNSGKLFVHSFNLTNKDRKNKDGDKCQLVNSTCSTTWAPFKKKGDSVTDKVDESLIQDWFLNFTDKEKNILGPKKWKKAQAGEEELAILLRSWLGRLDFMDIETEVMVDTKKLFKEDYKELRELISIGDEGELGEDGIDTPFVVLLGVRTDENDSTKKYQQIWSKGFLPVGFMKYVNNGNKFPTDYAKKVWKKFSEEATGEYGFDCDTRLSPIQEYNEADFIAGGDKIGKEATESTTSDY